MSTEDSKELTISYEAIRSFFEAADKLKNLGIIRSSRYLGDIGEYLCSNIEIVTLCKSLRNKGYDGLNCEGKKVEIKFHNAEKGTNIIMSEYWKNNNVPEFDILLVLLGPNSKIRPNKYKNNGKFLLYKIEDYKERVLNPKKKNKKKKENIAIGFLQELEPFIIDFDVNKKTENVN